MNTDRSSPFNRTLILSILMKIMQTAKQTDSYNLKNSSYDNHIVCYTITLTQLN